MITTGTELKRRNKGSRNAEREMTPSTFRERELQMQVDELANKVKNLEAELISMERQNKDLRDANFKLSCQSQAYFETKETLREALSSMGNPFR